MNLLITVIGTLLAGIGGYMAFVRNVKENKWYWMGAIGVAVIILGTSLPTSQFAAGVPPVRGNIGINAVQAPFEAIPGSMIDVTAQFKNFGSVTATQPMEICIFPRKWEGNVFTAFSSITTPGYCQNTFCNSRTLTMAPGATEDVTVSLKMPEQTTQDACNDLGSVWDSNGFVLVTGVFDNQGYTDRLVQNMGIKTCIPGAVCTTSQNCPGSIQCPSGTCIDIAGDNCPAVATTSTIPTTTTIYTTTTTIQSMCGNLICDLTETSVSCPTDCSNVNCGDNICQIYENAVMCPTDCGTTPGVCNNDGICGAGETFANCPGDCPPEDEANWGIVILGLAAIGGVALVLKKQGKPKKKEKADINEV